MAAYEPSGRWIVLCISLDFCKTKGCDVPYFIASEAELADLESSNVAFNGLRALNFNSLMRSCTGNEAGEVGSKSGAPVCNQCEPLDKSDTVFINGAGAMGEDHRFCMNHGNCIGKVFVLPAVSNPYGADNLKEQEFDIAVATLITASIDQAGGDVGLAKHNLTMLRQDAPDPEVYNNPVIVAAQHFLNGTASTGRGGSFLINFYEVTLKDDPDVLAVVDVAKKIPGAAWILGVNKDKPSSLRDERVERWNKAGQAFANKRKLAIANKKLVVEKLEMETLVLELLDAKAIQDIKANNVNTRSW